MANPIYGYSKEVASRDGKGLAYRQRTATSLVPMLYYSYLTRAAGDSKTIGAYKRRQLLTPGLTHGVSHIAADSMNLTIISNTRAVSPDQR